MINAALYKREMKGSLKMLFLFAAIISMYVTIIISMYDPEMMATLDSFYEVMPELMASLGMGAGAASLIGFIISYLYGFILLIFPMVFCILRGNGLIAKYVDRGSMVTLLASPIKRRTIAMTQLSVLISGILLLIVYVTGLEMAVAEINFPGELAAADLLTLNAALLCLLLFIGGICFLASCIFSWISPVWIIDQPRFAFDNARFRVFWHTTRIGVRATLIAPEPSWVLENNR